MCPYRIGWSRKGDYNLINYQFGGYSETGLEPDGSSGNWRCERVASISAAYIMDARGTNRSLSLRPAVTVLLQWRQRSITELLRLHAAARFPACVFFSPATCIASREYRCADFSFAIDINALYHPIAGAILMRICPILHTHTQSEHHITETPQLTATRATHLQTEFVPPLSHPGGKGSAVKE